MASKELRIDCPACRARLVADVRTEKVLSWQPAGSGSPRSKAREGDDAWQRAQERVEGRHARGQDRFEAALAKERDRELDLDERYDEVRPVADDDPFDAALARVRARDDRLAGRPPVARDDDRDATDPASHGELAPHSDAAPHTDPWIESLSAADRATLVSRTSSLAGWERAEPDWGAHRFGAAVVTVGPGYGGVFDVERATDEQLDAALAFAAPRPGMSAQLLPLSDQARHAARLLARGWRPTDADAVFWRDLAEPIETQLRHGSTRRALPGDLESWRRTLIRALGLSADDEQRRPERLAHEFGGEGWQLFCSSDEGEDVAAAALFVAGPVAVMGQAATLPEHRGRGHQKALIEARLRAAVAAGARIAISLPEMRGPSQSATRANGFVLAYHQQLWVPPATDA